MMKRNDHEYIEQLLYYGFSHNVLQRYSGLSLEEIHKIEEKRKAKQRELENKEVNK